MKIDDFNARVRETILIADGAGTAACERGFALARRMLDWAHAELAGAYLIPPFKRDEEITEIFA